MKRFFRFLMAAVVMFGAVACSQYDEQEVVEGQEVTTTFAIGLENLGTRVAGDSGMIDKVAWGIYEHQSDGKGRFLRVHSSDNPDNGPADFNGKTAEIEVTLFTGKKYDLVFFGYCSANKAYTIDWEKRELNVNYADKANLEARDAFYHVEPGFTAGTNKTFTLRRPFAQLNVGQSMKDFGIMQLTGNYIEKSSVTVKAYSKMKLTATKDEKGQIINSGPVVDDSIDVVTLEMNNVVSDNLTVNEVAYKHIAMNYLLVNEKQVVNDVEFKFTENTTTGAPTEFTRTYHNVPLQRNFRTNILGRIISDEYNFEIVIDADFNEPDNNYVTTIEDLQMVINSAQAGTAEKHKVTKVVLGADMKGDVTVHQKANTDIIIDGNEQKYKFDGTITINGDARAKGTETLTITNINFVTESAKTFIDAPTKVNGKYNYSHNVTVDNCTFSAAEYNEEVVGIKLLTTYNAVVKNCTAENIHSLAQFQSTDNATVIENVKVLNCKNGISLGNMASATITNAEISANGYGVRLDGAKEREVAVTIENATINAYIPVNVRKMNDDACKATVKFVGENALEGDSYEIAFCSNEYEDGVVPAAPKGTFTLDGAEGFDAYVGPIISASAFDAAINSNGDVTVESPINSVGTGFEVERDVVLDFQGNELNAGSTANSTWYALEIYGENDVEINNANFTRAGIFAGEGANVVFNNGVINHKPERTSRYIFCAQSGATITVNSGTFTNDRAKNSFFWADGSAIIYVKGGDFGGSASNKKVVTSNGGQVIITGGTFNFDPTAWLAEGYVATKSGSTWTVSKQ